VGDNKLIIAFFRRRLRDTPTQSRATALWFYLGIYFPIATVVLSYLILMIDSREITVVPRWFVYSIGWNLPALLFVCLLAEWIEGFALHSLHELQVHWSNRPLRLVLAGTATSIVAIAVAAAAIWLSWAKIVSLFGPTSYRGFGFGLMWIASISLASTAVTVRAMSSMLAHGDNC